MRILIVDDDPLVCQSLEILLNRELDMRVGGTAVDGNQALAWLAENTADIVLMDIQMPEMDGIQATRRIKSLYPQTRVLMLTTFRDDKNIRLALGAGAEGYLLKSDDISRMAEQVRAVMSGTAVMDNRVLRQLVQPRPQDWEQLTPRERDVAELVAQGSSNREIAEQLYLSEGTVRNTLSTVLDKLQLRDRTQLAVQYWRR